MLYFLRIFHLHRFQHTRFAKNQMTFISVFLHFVVKEKKLSEDYVIDAIASSAQS